MKRPVYLLGRRENGAEESLAYLSSKSIQAEHISTEKTNPELPKHISPDALIVLHLSEDDSSALLELCRAIRSDTRHLASDIVCYGPVDMHEAAFAAGATAYLQGPAQPAAGAAVLDSLLGLSFTATPRVPCNFEAVVVRDQTSQAGRLVDISPAGAFLVGASLPLGSNCKLRFSSADIAPDAELWARVHFSGTRRVSQTEQSGIDVVFLQQHNAHHQGITTWVQQKLERAKAEPELLEKVSRPISFSSRFADAVLARYRLSPPHPDTERLDQIGFVMSFERRAMALPICDHLRPDGWIAMACATRINLGLAIAGEANRGKLLNALTEAQRFHADASIYHALEKYRILAEQAQQLDESMQSLVPFMVEARDRHLKVRQESDPSFFPELFCPEEDKPAAWRSQPTKVAPKPQKKAPRAAQTTTKVARSQTATPQRAKLILAILLFLVTLVSFGWQMRGHLFGGARGTLQDQVVSLPTDMLQELIPLTQAIKTPQMLEIFAADSPWLNRAEHMRQKDVAALLEHPLVRDVDEIRVYAPDGVVINRVHRRQTAGEE